MRKIIYLSALVLATALGGTAARAQISVPSDAAPACNISSSTLNGWFSGGSVTLNGAAIPADSTAFPPINNTLCTFYQWASHMFLWLTSPTAGGVTFTGSSFFNIEPASGGGLQFVRNASNSVLHLRMRKQKPITVAASTSLNGTTEADGNVLIAQKSPVWNATTCSPQPQNPPDAIPVYYGIHSNDGYAYYVTGHKNNAFAGEIYNLFPSTLADLGQLELYVASGFKTTLSKPLTMTMVQKSAWVDVAAVSNPASYITISAQVPTYNTCNSATTWTQNTAAETKTLALVGLHVVGTVNGHPEMVWATFEHVDNAPNFSYSYTNNQTGSNTTTTVPYNSAGTWTFAPAGMAQPTQAGGGNYINATATTSGTSIVSTSSAALAPASVARLNPWGTAATDTNSLSSNTDLVSLNSSVMTGLASGDPRANYVQVGAVWSQFGQIPANGTDSVLKGGLSLANAAMETFAQNPDSTSGYVTKNCFGCHNSSGSTTLNPPGINISHIFGQLQPLPQPQQ